MICRVRAVVVIASVAALLVGAGELTAHAWRPCSSPPVVEILYPPNGAHVGRGTAILVHYRTKNAPTEIFLIDSRTNKKIRLSREVSATGKLIRLRPTRRLRRGRTYTIAWASKEISRYTIDLKRRPNRPRPVGAGKVVFTDSNPPVNRTRPGPFTHRAGRAAWVVFATNADQIAVVEMKVTFWSGAIAAPWTVNLIRRYYPTGAGFAHNGNGCHQPSPAPASGHYTLAVTPWSVQGRRLKTYHFAGPIH